MPALVRDARGAGRVSGGRVPVAARSGWPLLVAVVARSRRPGGGAALHVQLRRSRDHASRRGHPDSLRLLPRRGLRSPRSGEGRRRDPGRDPSVKDRVPVRQVRRARQLPVRRGGAGPAGGSPDVRAVGRRAVRAGRLPRDLRPDPRAGSSLRGGRRGPLRRGSGPLRPRRPRRLVLLFACRPIALPTLSAGAKGPGILKRRPAFDPAGAATLEVAIQESVPGGKEFSSGLNIRDKPFPRVPWNGIPIRPDLVAARAAQVFSVVPLLALQFADRF